MIIEQRKMRISKPLICSLLLFTLAACENKPPTETTIVDTTNYDIVIRGGTVYDGSGGNGFIGDIAINDDRIVAVGDIGSATAATEIDATGLAVSPGFINLMSWAVISLIEDGRGMSDIKQGVTLEVMGEGTSMGPLTEADKEEFKHQWGVEAQWTSLDEYLVFLENKGVSPNVASFIGAASVRIHELGFDNVRATPEQLASMQDLVRTAMREGALGVASSLIYPPGNYADTDELIALARAAGEHGGIYISHMRNEADGMFEALDELITIAREAEVPAEIYHFKLASKNMWDKFDEMVAKVEAARAEGLKITADMYTYPAGSTGLGAVMPPWVEEGGNEKWLERLQDPEMRARIREEMHTPTTEWENMFTSVGPERTLLVGFVNKDLHKYVGMTLAEVAAERGTDPAYTAMDLVVEDEGRVTAIYFSQSEEVVKRATGLPWMSFCSDSEAVAAEGKTLETSTHPRAYGSFARLFAKYVREEQALTLAEAVRRATSFPAENLSITDRGRLKSGYFADIVVFNPATIQDHATFEQPHQYATGVEHVLVNGVRVLKDGEHTGATPGRVVRGPGWQK